MKPPTTDTGDDLAVRELSPSFPAALSPHENATEFNASRGTMFVPE